MTNFNTDVAAIVSSTKMTTAYAVVQSMVEVINAPVVNQVKSSLIKEDLYKLADQAKRTGCYQVFGAPFGVQLYINGYKIQVSKVLGRIVFNLNNKQGFVKYNASLENVKEFLKEIIEGDNSQ